MNVSPTRLPGVLIVEPKLFRDDRGHFLELWHQGRYESAGLPATFVQDNVSRSARGVLRGLHYQHPSAQGKLVSVLEGAIFDVAVDVRVGSPTFGRWAGVRLDAGTGRQLYVPEGFAHGFVVTSEAAVVLYKCTRPYAPSDEGIIAWDDPELAVEWPVSEPTLATKDRGAPRLSEVDPRRLPSL